jgi:lipid-binding SYLF domain-containing protein
LQTIGNNAFENSTFDTITIGANATLGTGCIGAHSEEFISDYEANGKLAGTYVWDGTHWIYQT